MQQNFEENMNKNFGFTLVEISIVMIIIGLLIGGTFSGLAMIDNTKVNSTVQQIKKFEAAAINFKQIYGYYPGDLGNPTSVLSNCESPCDISGNQDGKIGAGWFGWTGFSAWHYEGNVFWHQLTVASMIEGTVSGGSSGGTVFGTHIPLSPFDTGYVLSYNGIVSTGRKGSMIVITNTGFSSPLGGTTANDLVLPGSAAQKLDAKIDDGDAIMGKFLSWNASPPVAAYDINTSYGSRYLYNF